MIFADTNWLTALYFEANPERKTTVERFMRKSSGKLTLSHIVLMEARNVFSQIAREPEPEEWRELQNDFHGKIYVDPMNWHLLRREAGKLFARYSAKESIGTLDTLIVTSAKLAGATQFLTFDSLCAALACAEGLDIFPSLNQEGRACLKKLSGK